jgi:thiamine biosynthesis protein ThiS
MALLMMLNRRRMMEISVNGQLQQVDENYTIAQLLGTLGLENQRLAVELNLAIVPRSLFGTRILTQGDKIEIVQAIGGG